MDIKFEEPYVYQIHEDRKIYKGTLAEQSSGSVIYDGLTISEVEQILAKMKELQREVACKATTDINSYDPSSPNGYD